MGFSRQEYWSGLPFPSPEDLPNQGIEPRSLALQADSLLSEPPEKPRMVYRNDKSHPKESGYSIYMCLLNMKSQNQKREFQDTVDFSKSSCKFEVNSEKTNIY